MIGTLSSDDVSHGGVPPAVFHMDRCIAAYADRCRERVPAFVARHFTLNSTWATQRQTLWNDLVLGPINSLWAIPYLTLKRICNGLDVLGVPGARDFLRQVPSGVRTGYQRAIESAIASEVLEWNPDADDIQFPAGLLDEWRRHPDLARTVGPHGVAAAPSLHALLDGFSAGRALVADLSGGALTLGCGWLLFDSASLGVVDLASRLARANARQRAARGFFLGRRAGGAFYTVFQPGASLGDTVLALTAIALGLAAGTLACAVLLEPLRRMLGLHERRLYALIDGLERELTLIAHRQLMPRLSAVDSPAT